MNNTFVEIEDSLEIRGGQDEYNYAFVRAQRAYFNDRVRARGFVTLNEVLEALGFHPTKAGLTEGWAKFDIVELRYEPASGGVAIENHSDLVARVL